MTPTQILHAIYLSVIAAIIFLGGAAMIWWHHDAVLEGKAEVDKQVAAAAADQRLKDVKASQDVIDGLNEDKQRLQAMLSAVPATPPPPIRKCGRLFYVEHPLPEGSATTGIKPGDSPKPAVDSGVSEGSGSGDVGPGVRDIALAGELLALYRERLYQFTVATR